MDLFTAEILRKATCTVKEFGNHLLEIDMKVSIDEMLSLAPEFIIGKMAMFMKAYFKMDAKSLPARNTREESKLRNR